MPFGRFAKPYNPEFFQEHENVIVFTMDDINRRYTSIMAEIDFINKIDLQFDRDEEWKLIGYWPKIMQSLHRIDVNMDLIFKKEPAGFILTVTSQLLSDRIQLKSLMKESTDPEKRQILILDKKHSKH